MSANVDKIYTITPLGLLTLHLDEETASRIAGVFELYMRRQNKIMVVEGNRLHFAAIAESDATT